MSYFRICISTASSLRELTAKARPYVISDFSWSEKCQKFKAYISRKYE